MTISLQAQNFPEPYCDIDDTDTTTEEITSIVFADADITNTDMSSILVDKTASVANLQIGETYTITAEGNTYGDFSNYMVAFIDWNQDEILDDANEVYEIGTLVNSDGNDGTSISFDITVPADALAGSTRIRITKTYGDPQSIALINPCAIEMDAFGQGANGGFGQAIDFTLDVTAAPEFPAPYCDIDDTDTTTEEITSIIFADADITNTDTSSILVDKTATIANLQIGETYTITVEGNTYGDFDNDIVAFIDWNQNEILDDANEVYEIGTLINSDGNDGTSISFDITVPADALTGSTRIRVTKTYGDPQSIALINPCAIEMDAFGQGANGGYGQAIDFTLDIETLGTNQFDKNALTVYPIPTRDFLNIEYKDAIDEVTVYNHIGQEVYLQKSDSSKLQLNLSNLKSGIYFVKLSSNETQHNFKIVKE